MLIIRFSRTGRKNRAHFSVVLTEKSFPVKGKFIEKLGSYNPHSKEAVLDVDAIKSWIEKGASLSGSVHNLLLKEGVIKGEKKKVAKLPKKEKEEVQSSSENSNDKNDKKDNQKEVKEKK